MAPQAAQQTPLAYSKLLLPATLHHFGTGSEPYPSVEVAKLPVPFRSILHLRRSSLSATALLWPFLW